MEKIMFEDATLTSQAKVTIDGVDHLVTEAEYGGGTDLNANTFNQLQDNVENAIEESKLEEYSTSEQRIGTWIDGKPLYRKSGIYSETIEKDTLTILASVGSGIIDKVTRYEVLSRINITVDNRSHEAPVYTSTGNFCIKPSTSIQEAIFVAEYTKTTD